MKICEMIFLPNCKRGIWHYLQHELFYFSGALNISRMRRCQVKTMSLQVHWCWATGQQLQLVHTSEMKTYGYEHNYRKKISVCFPYVVIFMSKRSYSVVVILSTLWTYWQKLSFLLYLRDHVMSLSTYQALLLYTLPNYLQTSQPILSSIFKIRIDIFFFLGKYKIYNGIIVRMKVHKRIVNIS